MNKHQSQCRGLVHAPDYNTAMVTPERSTELSAILTLTAGERGLETENSTHQGEPQHPTSVTYPGRLEWWSSGEQDGKDTQSTQSYGQTHHQNRLQENQSYTGATPRSTASESSKHVFQSRDLQPLWATVRNVTRRTRTAQLPAPGGCSGGGKERRAATPPPPRAARSPRRLPPLHTGQGQGQGHSGRQTDPAFPPPLSPTAPGPGSCAAQGKAFGSSCGGTGGKCAQGPAKEGAGGGRVPGPAPHQPSTQSREGSPLESSSCPWRTEGRVPATAARRLPAAALRWKLVAPRPRAAPPPAAAAAISAASRLTGPRGTPGRIKPFPLHQWESGVGNALSNGRPSCLYVRGWRGGESSGPPGGEQAGECGGAGPRALQRGRREEARVARGRGRWLRPPGFSRGCGVPEVSVTPELLPVVKGEPGRAGPPWATSAGAVPPRRHHPLEKSFCGCEREEEQSFCNVLPVLTVFQLLSAGVLAVSFVNSRGPVLSVRLKPCPLAARSWGSTMSQEL